jgi:AcrR family transcriptional regulator
MGIRERKARERERRRQQIIVAAKRVFSEKGFSRATMEDIANEAELSPGTLYLYFKNKDELYASLSLRILHYFNIRLEHLSKGYENSSVAERVMALKEVMYDVYEYDPLILINMFHLQSSEALRNITPELLSEIKELSCNSLNEIAKLFEEGVDKSALIKKPPIAIADVLWSLFSGIVLWETSKRIINQDKDFLKDTLDTAFEIFSRGIQRQT